MNDDEAQIRQLLEEWNEALRAKDATRMLTHYAPDVLVFDAVPPYQTQGAEAYRQSWASCLPYFPSPLQTEVRDLKVTVSGDLAFTHCLHHITGVNEDPKDARTWMRVTVCYQRREGAWQVVHEHVSVPFDPQTSQAAFIRDPATAS